MNENRASLEIIAPSVEEAVAKGLSDLDLPEDAVEVEILDEGSRGLFGLGSRQARVRLTIKKSQPSGSKQTEPAQKAEPVAAAEPAQPAAAIESQPTAAPLPDELSPEDENTLRVARETVADLLEKMKVRAEVASHFGEAEDTHSRIPVLVEVSGNDLSILIGRRAETLNALQYIASLIVGKELGKSVPLIVDVEGYRVRREQQLRQLARRMAEQAIKTGRRQVLEPMPSNERRVIHIELRGNSNVTTESIGEEPRRKVTILPK